MNSVVERRPTLVWIEAVDGVLASEADAEGPAGGGAVLGAGHLHDVQVAVGGDEVHAAQHVRPAVGLLKRGACFRLQLLSKLKPNTYVEPI